MHAEWDLVKLDFPDRVFNTTYMADKGQDYIVQFSAVSRTDSRYTDAVDVRLHPVKVPEEKIYGRSSAGSSAWLKTDHCQITKPAGITGAIRDATHNVFACTKEAGVGQGINVVPSTNPDVVPRFTTRDVETVNPLCTQSCVVDPVKDSGDGTVFSSGMCRKTAAEGGALCAKAIPTHHITWANPAVSGVKYDGSTVVGARPGDYLAFEWDDVVRVAGRSIPPPWGSIRFR